MITRFTQIRGVGRFQDCQNLGGRHFSKNTIIFGRNTGGKSTITDVLWSFKTGDPAFIEGRKTFGFAGSQHVVLVDDQNNTYQYPSRNWELGFPSIEIFDTQFIYDNIFDGTKVNFDNQKNLQKLIIGSKGKILAEEIASLQGELDELTKKKTAKTGEFNRIFKREISPEEFRELNHHENVDELLEKVKNEIDTFINQDKIKTVFATIDAILENILNQKTKEILSESISISIDSVTDHILRTWKDKNQPKDFLRTGLELTKDEHKDCVFCGQDLNQEAKALLEAYSQLFSEKYTRLHASISEAVMKFEKWTPDAQIESIQDKLSSINLSIEYSKDAQIYVKEMKSAADFEFSKKLRELSTNIDFIKYDELISYYYNLKAQVTELKQKNIVSNKVDIKALTSKLAKLEHSKTRHTKEWDDFFRESDDIDIIQEKKRVRRESLRTQIDQYSNNLFSTHYDTINKVLGELGADFVIRNLAPMRKLVGQTERIFALTFFTSHHVAIDESANNKPNFKNTLSESDKRVLAFAFFYSLMMHDEKLIEKIIVFDDPFSSFDSDRRTKMIELLSNPHLIKPTGERVEKKFDQLIILTHERDFFKWLFQKLENPKALQIIGDGLDSNGVKTSTIVDCNVYSEFVENENTRDLKQIYRVYNSNEPIQNYEALCVKCRKILESIFSRKYLLEIQEEIELRKSIRSFIVKLRALQINDFDSVPKFKDFIQLCDNLNIDLHESTMNNEGENARIVLGDFLRLVKEI